MKQKMKKFLTEEILTRLAGLIDVFEFILNPPRSYRELFYEHLYEARKELEKRWLKKKIDMAFHALKKRKYLIFKKINGREIYFLSPKGVEKILKIKLKERTKAEKLKDKYLVVIFDIPEKMRSKRNVFRDCLKRLKFEQLQKSIWISQDNLLKEITAFAKIYQVEPYVKFMIAQKISKKDLKK